MKQNVGSIDRLIRLIIGAVIFTLFYKDYLNGPFAVLLVMLAIILIGTAILGVCPIYKLLHINTSSKELL